LGLQGTVSEKQDKFRSPKAYTALIDTHNGYNNLGTRNDLIRTAPTDQQFRPMETRDAPAMEDATLQKNMLEREKLRE